MVEYINDNGRVIRKEEWSISPDNRSFRYGDGCFETIKILNGKILLADFHFERLFSSLDTLKFSLPKVFTAQKLAEQIVEVANKNNHQQHARIRLTCYRGNGGLYDDVSDMPNYLIQSWALADNINQLNENGIIVDYYKDGRKSADSFSALKSNNFLVYTMGAIWAKQHHLNDVLILNSFGNIADATIANVFIVQNGTVTTPPLVDGAVNGVMRRYLLNCLNKEGIPTNEQSISTEDILNASEVFLTNAIQGIRWVKQVGNSNYSNQLSTFLHNKFINTLFS